jgi:hypothetical protein
MDTKRLAKISPNRSWPTASSEARFPSMAQQALVCSLTSTSAFPLRRSSGQERMCHRFDARRPLFLQLIEPDPDFSRLPALPRFGGIATE